MYRATSNVVGTAGHMFGAESVGFHAGLPSAR
jgi:hypothetical protein